MKNTIIVITFCLLNCIYAAGNERAALLKELDHKVANRAYYMNVKEARIDSLRKLIQPGTEINERYRINHLIYKEYSTYRYDSAMHYVQRNKDIAARLNCDKYKDETTIATAILLATTGIYREAIDNLNRLDRAKLDSSLLPEYFDVSEWTYYAAGEYTNDSVYAPGYRYMEGLYRDSVFSMLRPETERHEYYKGKILLHDGKLEDALRIFLKAYPTMRVDTRLYAIITYDIASIYQRFGNMDMYERFLILAAISDQVNPLKENLAMQELALYLFTYKPDELDRAYTYIQCSMEDARFYNNRLRIVQISEKLPIIVAGYKQKSERENHRLAVALSVISILSLISIASMLYTWKQMKTVKRKRHELRILNNELNTLNTKLHEANHTKEEYVGLFMDLCSTYIDKLDKYRLTVKRKVMANQIDELYKLTNSTRSIETELDDFFYNFDTAFLSLYPAFVKEFNALLTDDNQVSLKKGELLNTELRIFALIRLGITDSSKIATFLRYSPQTIYNYRVKVKNKARGDRSQFEEMVKQIGELTK